MRSIKRLALSAAALLAVGSPLTAQSDDALQPPVAAPLEASLDTKAAILPAQTRLVFLMAEEISSKKVRKGDLIQLTLMEDLTVDGQMILPAGTPAVGEVTRAQKKGFMGLGGRLAARMLYFDLETGPVRISGPLASVGNDRTELATAATTATLGIAFFVTGKSAVIPEGAPLELFLERAARIPRPTALAAD
ncbi:MAG: hypothetical protein AAF250_04775 [Pseudomonadota bacterium]